MTLAARLIDPDHVELAVRDTDRDIPREAMAQLLVRFGVPGDVQPTGTGLGLSIVREILKANGGTVRCEVGRSLRPWYRRWFGQSPLEKLLRADVVVCAT